MTPTARLCEQLGLRYPILQAPIGSASCAPLAAAVSEAGGLGGLAATWLTPIETRQAVAAIRHETQRAFQVNFVLAFEVRSLETALEAGARVVTLSWGDPAPYVARVKAHSALVGVQVTTAAGATHALDSGADFLVCQGVEAGGHVQATRPLMAALEDVLRVASDVPVVAAGGLATVDHVRSVIRAGAAGAMLGTRFVATVESRAHTQYKVAITRAAGEDATLTACFAGGWPYAPHRVLRNSTLDGWESAGCPPIGSRPGEEDTIAWSGAGQAIPRYADATPLADTRGAVQDMALYAGSGCGEILDIPSAADVVRELGADWALEAQSLRA